MKKVLRITWKIIKWLFLSLLIIFVLLFIVLRVPASRQYIVSKASDKLSELTNAQISIADVDLRLPFYVGVEKINVASPEGEQILSVDEIGVSIGWRYALTKTLRVDKLSLTGVTGKVYRNPNDSLWNYQFILDAFADTSAVEKPEAETAPADSSGWGISVGTIALSEFNIRYLDAYNGDTIKLDLGSLDVDFDKFSLDPQRFYVDEIKLQNTTAYVALSGNSEAEPTDTTESAMPDVALDLLTLNNVDVAFSIASQKMDTRAIIDRFELEIDEIDLNNQVYHVDHITFENSKLAYKSALLPDTTGAEIDTTPTLPADTALSVFGPFDVRLDELDLDGLDLSYHSGPGEAQSGFDPNHLDIDNLVLKASDLVYNDHEAAADLDEFHFGVNEEFRLDRLTFSAGLSEKSAYLKDLELVFGDQTAVSGSVEVDFPTLQALITNQQYQSLETDLQARVFLADLKDFVPALSADSSLARLANDSLLLQLEVRGEKNGLKINTLEARLGETNLDLKAQIADLANWKSSAFNLTNLEVKTTAAGLHHLSGMSEDTIGFKFPPNVYLKTSASGRVSDFKLNTNLNTTYGVVSVRAKLRDLLEQVPKYQAAVAIDTLWFGKLLQSGADQVTATITVEGQGSEPATMNADLKLHIDSLTSAGYRFTNVDLTAQTENGLAKLQTSLRDSNIVAALKASANIGSMTDFAVDLDVEAADLQNLRLTQKDVRLSANLEAELSSTDISDMKGGLRINNILFINESRRYPMDSVVLDFALSEDSISLNLNSEIVTATAASNKGVEDLLASLKQEFNKHYQYSDSVGRDETANAAVFDFDLKVENSQVLQDFLLPDLKEMQPGVVNVHYAEADGQINSNVNFPFINYGSFTVDSLTASTRTTRDSLLFNFGFREVSMDTLSLKNLSINGSAGGKKMVAALAIKDSLEKNLYFIKAHFEKSTRDQEFEQKISLDQNLVLNRKKWNVNPDNGIFLSEAGMRVPLLKIERQGSYLQLEKQEVTDSLYLTAKGFELANLIQILNREVPLINGDLGGSFTLYADNSFESKLRIDELSASGTAIGDLKLDVENLQKNRFDLQLGLHGQGSDLSMEGYYLNYADSSQLDLNLDLNKLEMATIQQFSLGNLSSSKGYVSGEIKVSGSTNTPKINGQLNFNDVRTRIAFNNGLYSIDNSSIEIDPTAIKFPNFTISDSTGNTAVINGAINHKNFDNINFDLSLKTDDFRLLSTTSEDNELYYGTVILDSDIKITGPTSLPKINSKIELEKGTNITFVVPESDYQDLEKEGLVKFVNFDKDLDEEILTRDKEENATTEVPLLSGIDLTSTISIDRETIFKVVIDPIAGDHLELQGGADLYFTYSPAGIMNLSGAYTIVEGSYLLTFYNLVKKKFEIEEGSRVTWSGDPMAANLDITAIYETRTSALPLLASYTAGSAGSVKQLILFHVLLNIEGQLTDPRISFDIRTAPEDRGALGGQVDARLNQMRQDQSEMNKQVFALLILNSFITTGPSAEGPGLVDKTVRNSASQILTQQLNKLSDKYVKGVNIDLNLDSYAGAKDAQTDLNVDISKSFLNDRLTVKVGSTIALEGEEMEQTNNASNLAGNIVIEYKLTEDGRYKFKVFRTTDFEDIVVGQVTDTGIGVVFTRDYDSIKDLFAKPEETDE